MPQNFIDHSGGIYSGGVVLVDRVTGTPSDNVKDFRTAALIDKVGGARGFVITGHSPSIQTTDAPHLLWDAKISYPFQTSAQSLEVVSDSASDSAAGTGARTVVVTTLDSSYVEQTQVVTLNGMTPVALTGTHIHLNSFVVISSGSASSNVGNLSVRVAGAGALQGHIPIGKSIQRALKYTVPAGKVLVIDNFYLNAITFSGATARVTLNFNVRLENGTILVSQENYLSSTNAPFSITLPTGIRVEEKTTVFTQVQAVSANNANMAASVSGFLFTPSLL
jgi:hypothetical protein